MAIVKMKRLRLLALRPEREKLLRTLQSLGCVEIREPAIDLSDPEWGGLAKPESAGLEKAREQSLLLNNALEVLRKYAPAKEGMFAQRPEITEGELFDDGVYAEGLAAARQVMEAEQALAVKTAERSKLLTQKASLEPWSCLDVPLDTEGTATVPVHFCSVPGKTDFAALEAAVGQATELAQLVRGGSDRELQYYLLICHSTALSDCNDAMRPFGASRVTLRGWTGTAAENIALLDNRIAALAREEEQCRTDIAAQGGKRDALRRCVDRAAQEISREENKSRLVDTDAAFLLDGWLPADKLNALQKALSGYACAWETADPAPEEYPVVPVKLKNNFITRSMNTITEMYSLPAYDGVDPNPLMAPFFILFFGMIMADMAYGLLMIIAAAVVLVKAKPRNPNFMEMILWCGVSTVLWGAASGGFFGDMIPQLITMVNPESTFEMPALFTALDDIVAIMIGSLVLGVIQVFTGMMISVVKKSKDGEFIDALFNEISWWIVLAGLAMLICGMLLAGVPAVLGAVGKVLLIVGFLMLAVGGTREAKGFGKLTSFIGIIYNGVTGFFSDILSYIRLMALMVSGSVIASVFNTLGATTGIVPVFILISLLGNALNLALSLLGAYVHDLRLQCLEFFGRFYKEGGMPYEPLSIQTKYIDVIKEEN